MVSSAARRAGRAGDGFPRQKTREAMQLGRELGAKAVQVDGIRRDQVLPPASCKQCTTASWRWELGLWDMSNQESRTEGLNGQCCHVKYLHDSTKV